MWMVMLMHADVGVEVGGFIDVDVDGDVDVCVWVADVVAVVIVFVVIVDVGGGGVFHDVLAVLGVCVFEVNDSLGGGGAG